MGQVVKKVARKRGMTLQSKQINVTFSMLFNEGKGNAQVRIKKSRVVLHTLDFLKTGEQSLLLDKDNYRVLLDGETTGNAVFSMSKETSPATPDHFTEGPIDGSYSLDIE
jgi:archaellum component FlaG (FlaF/FlaG flagellin family)